MNSDKTKNLIVIGLRILLFIASGISAYFGIKELVNKSQSTVNPNTGVPPVSNQPPIQSSNQSDVIIGDSGLSEKGQKVVGVLGIISSVCLGIFEVVKSLGTVTNSVDRLLHKKRYIVAGRDGYIEGNFPWNTPEQRGLPNNVPIYRGQDGKKNDIYWIQREEGITDVW